jgi:putative transposase
MVAYNKLKPWATRHVNHKRVHRVYREAGLRLRRKKRKHCVREGKPLLARTAANQEWALDFVHDAVECGRAMDFECLRHLPDRDHAAFGPSFL